VAAGAVGRPVPRRVPRGQRDPPGPIHPVGARRGQDGQLPPIETTSVSETPLTPLGRVGQALKRLVFGPPLDATAIAVERMRKLVPLPVLSADALSWVAYGPQAMLAVLVLVLAGLPGSSYSLPVGAAIAFLMLAVGISCRQTIRAYPQGRGSFIVASEELGRVRAVVAHWPTTSGPCTSNGRTSH
jgi:hypothetical protein